jgi:hypothetical protein
MVELGKLIPTDVPKLPMTSSRRAFIQAAAFLEGVANPRSSWMAGDGESGPKRALKAFRFQQFKWYSSLIALSSLVCLG